MGDPRRLGKKYAGPRHPWQSERIVEERALMIAYGLNAKNELWKASSKLKSFASQAKKLIALQTVQAERETKQLLERLASLGLLSKGAKLDDVLALTLKDVLDRRLQTVVVKRGLARTQRQSRQFIIHQHIMVGSKALSVPSYLVPVEEESKVSFVAQSDLGNPEHVARVVPVKSGKAKSGVSK